jgi:hypothetical protein
MALFMAGYEYDLVDSKGNLLERPPIPDYNSVPQVRYTFASLRIELGSGLICTGRFDQVKPKGGPCFINFRRIVD